MARNLAARIGPRIPQKSPSESGAHPPRSPGRVKQHPTPEDLMRYVLCASLAVAPLLSCSYDREVPSDPRVSMLREDVLPAARYTVSYLPTLGGSRNRAAGISNSGLVAGFVNRPGNATRVAVFWRAGSLDTLGTLGGPNSIVQWPGISNNGIIAGITETSVLDPTCNPPQKLQFRAILWDTKKGTKRELRPLPGDSTSAATEINNQGQVVGISGDCDIAVGQLS